MVSLVEMPWSVDKNQLILHANHAFRYATMDARDAYAELNHFIFKMDEFYTSPHTKDDVYDLLQRLSNWCIPKGRLLFGSAHAELLTRVLHSCFDGTYLKEMQIAAPT